MNILFQPHPGAQKRFMEFKGRYALLGGALGGGKTSCLIYDPFRQIKTEFERLQRGEIKKSTGRALLLRRTYPELREIIGRIRRTFEQIDPDGKWHGTDKTFTFSCGYEYILGNMEDADDYLKYFGLELTWLGWDELTSFTEDQFDHLDTRVRSSDPVLKTMLAVRAGTNPVGPGLEWVRRRFVEIAPPGTQVIKRIRTPIITDGVTTYEWVETSQIFIPSGLADNPSIDQRQYGAIIASKSPEVRKALLEGDWYALTSSEAWVSGLYDSKVHVCKKFKIPDGWFKFRSGTYGATWPRLSSFDWWANDLDGNLVCYRSISVTGIDAHEQAQMIRSVEMDNGEWNVDRDCSKLTGPLNHLCFPQDGDSGPTVEEAFREVGVFWTKASKAAVGAAEQLRIRLRRRTKRRDKAGKVTETPGIRWFDTCWNFVKKPDGQKVKTGPVVTIPSLPRDEKKPEIWAKNGSEHNLDSVGFAVMSRPVPGKDVLTPDEDELDAARERAARGRSGNAWSPGGYW